MWRNLINRFTRRWPRCEPSAGRTWEAADRQAAQQRLRDLAARRRAAHLYDGPSA
ncbi:hypothetical protein [Micromonospora sp. WMMD710]|uniref:hypothetical protein n=1 Tax=Micromonospora sp. WMMD710 TaxID=3016085 RepID=UPI0024160749|nr:hypothetical protein [Micromonospora sp. WMMD710]MDG4762368.1 hypothetical protein [Micromonospora sp. WMMD710]MDG4762388.1 hypothetical protein [Micromonospora sp. WMMD710]MDG4762414.1 hypothetical protein [Micromonospora sp. WMMD710]MDG4762460.1 hypothetical protein [Micromonospora sp. WMMD710]MDG4762495.1 hypothetical protein [Micromonospora sp. WMMD710]